jgi:hypothetical protein
VETPPVETPPVETPPGAQAQVDWAHFPGVVVGGKAVDLLAMHMVLSWSRAEAVVWSRGKDTLAWLACHTACLARLGGVPATLRVDNERTAVSRGAGAWGTVNPAYRRYAALMRFHVDACAPRQPRAKGKAERRVRDHRQALAPYGRSFADLAELQAWTDERVATRAAELQAWTDERVATRAAERRCPATGTGVAEAWARGRPLLTALPETAPEPFDVVVARTVGRDGLVAFEGRQYSVPCHLAGDTAEVRGVAGAVQVLKACRVVALHPPAGPSAGSSSTGGTTTGRAHRGWPPRRRSGGWGRGCRSWRRRRWRGARSSSTPRSPRWRGERAGEAAARRRRDPGPAAGARLRLRRRAARAAPAERGGARRGAAARLPRPAARGGAVRPGGAAGG